RSPHHREAQGPHCGRGRGLKPPAREILSNPSAAVSMRPNADPTDPAVTRFLDAVWMERGLSPNTLAAYRADLTALARWLTERNVRGTRGRRGKRPDQRTSGPTSQRTPRRRPPRARRPLTH